MSKYREKLKDPRWQKKRLEILSRDQFTCTRCDDHESSLHVHHLYYKKESEPWEYPNKALITLCERCHNGERNYKESQLDLTTSLIELGALTQDMISLALAFRGKIFVHEKSLYFRALSDLIGDSLKNPKTQELLIKRYEEKNG